MKRKSQIVGGLLITIAAFLAAAGPAAAYPPGVPNMTVMGGDTDEGIAVSITGLQGGSAVTIEWHQVTAAGFLALAPAATSGEESVALDAAGDGSTTLEATEAGTYSVTGTGTDPTGAAWTETATVTVTEAEEESGGSGSGGGGGDDDGSTTDSGGLAHTGSDSTTTLVVVGLGAIMIGLAAVFGARARRWGTSS